MVNIGNGNLLVQADDVDIHERGVDLAFRRTYNSMSNHDASNADHSTIANFGNGWTNTFDAHIAYYNGSNTISVYDIDGTRYDYTASGGGAWLAPPGMQGTSLTLASQSGYSNNCYYQWTKKNGTAYVFYAPDYHARPCAQVGIASGLDGRIAEIFGRNSNNYVQFLYSWQGGIVDSAHLASIVAAHADGQQLVLSFTLTNGTSACDGSGPCELHSITRPDNQAITYSYDSLGNLSQVNLPGNNVSSTLWENYNYTGNHLLSEISSPRYSYSYVQTGGNPVDGTTTNFGYNASGQLQYMQNDGVVNFAPGDGTGTLLQPNMPTGVQPYYQQNFSGYNGSACTIGLSGSTIVVTSSGGNATTSVTDTDGHSTKYTIDGCWRLGQTQIYTGQLWLLNSEAWDASNNLTATTDDNGNETDYGYDTSGNTIWVQQPQIQTSLGSGRPVARYTYDQYNNVVAYCDPQYVWSSGVTNCPATTGATHYTWSYSDSAQPYGVLTDTYTALGYHRSVSYDYSAEGGGDFGLPTALTGDCVSQSDGSTRCPHLQISYDAFGNAACYSTFQDANGSHWSRATYDVLGRRLASADADDGSLAVPQCTNSAGLSGSRIQSTATYFANGQIASIQTPSQYASGVSSAFSYDADGNETSESHYYGNQEGVTQKYYDGDGRLVEVVEPTNNASLSYGGVNYGNPDIWPWLTRYLYDSTQDQTVSMQSGASYAAHGNLFKTERWLPGKEVTIDSSGTISVQSAALTTATGATATSKHNGGASSSSARAHHPAVKAQRPRAGSRALPSGLPLTVIRPGKTATAQELATQGSAAVATTTGSWLDVSGTAYDSLDRRVAEYHYIPGTDTIATRSYSYDTGAAGELISETSPVGDVTKFTYDGAGHQTNISFTVSSASTYTAPRNYVFDPDGRVASVGNAEFGTWLYAYTADGDLASLTEPSGGSGIPGMPYSNSGALTSPVTFRNTYYADDMIAEVQAVTSSASYSENDSYRSDGLPQTQSFTAISGSIARRYTAAGRLLQRTDPAGSDTLQYDAFGRESNEAVPSGTYGSFSYDAEDEPSYTVTALNGRSLSPTNTFTVTGQIANPGGGPTYFFDSVPLTDEDMSAGGGSTGVQNCPQAEYTGNTIVDTRNLQAIGTAVFDAGSGALVDTASNYFDADGRITETNAPTIAGDCTSGWSVSNVVGRAYQYDAENHVTAAAADPQLLDHYYSWGPIGHPVTTGTCGVIYDGNPASCTTWYYSAWHWDAAHLAVESRSDGTITDYKLGLDGDVLPTDVGYSGATFYDRDPSGLVFSEHNATGSSAFSSISNGAYSSCSMNSYSCGLGWQQQLGNSSSNAKLPTFEDNTTVHESCSVTPCYMSLDALSIATYHRSDGVNNGFETINGVRNFSSVTLQWTTPDAYSGDISDPMSQSKYMWNDNNPIMYSDPSGYAPCAQTDEGSGRCILADLPADKYKAIRKKIKGVKGWQAHHIIPQRFAEQLGLNKSEMLSKAVPVAVHQQITKAWYDQLKYGMEHSTENIVKAAKAVERMFPVWLKDTGKAINEAVPEMNFLPVPSAQQILQGPNQKNVYSVVPRPQRARCEAKQQDCGSAVGR